MQHSQSHEISLSPLIQGKKHLLWVDGIKAFAIIGILLNHFVESYHSYPWFSNPANDWADLATRMSNLIPTNGTILWRIIQFIGWLGGMGPGVFLVVSGMTITMSFLSRPLKPIDFYKKRLLRIYPLYITLHFLLLLVCKFLFHWEIHLFSINTLLSIVGLRFTDSLFFYINPSWWFIWLILQMYFFFPFLIHLLQKRGLSNFIWITLGITVLSRLLGIGV